MSVLQPRAAFLTALQAIIQGLGLFNLVEVTPLHSAEIGLDQYPACDITIVGEAQTKYDITHTADLMPRINVRYFSIVSAQELLQLDEAVIDAVNNDARISDTCIQMYCLSGDPPRYFMEPEEGGGIYFQDRVFQAKLRRQF